mmetsp:Transcript_12596/g.18799  ORF Transcript_12596/g.18799 Transcript_12596/m.18799 type:complete len:81 (+) Transcript_12596:103-345(+)
MERATAFTYSRDYFGDTTIIVIHHDGRYKNNQASSFVIIIVRRSHGMKKNKTTNHLFPFSIACYIAVITYIIKYIHYMQQ